ncbi:hypothetical protein LINPERHAP1_LOCUS18125 [Linum perenne]
MRAGLPLTLMVPSIRRMTEQLLGGLLEMVEVILSLLTS